ncbi:unnamed protein product [Symbiodinium natans]|uniref:Uncharacterized protein n=1 Tax=Symbiodinium natans TaxID=878477 RepID=A0A812QGP4_9DINO|nr:unnamed protein product [Symbiodinium natans]
MKTAALVLSMPAQNWDTLESPKSTHKLPSNSSLPGAASGMEELLVAAMRSKDSPALKELVKKVAEMIATMKAPMKQSVGGIQTTMDESAKNVEKCGVNKHTENAKQFKSDFTAKSELHSQCRASEQAKLTKKTSCDSELASVTDLKDTACNALAALEKTMFDYKDQCGAKTGETFKAYHTRLAEASNTLIAKWDKLSTECADAKKKFDEKTTSCKSSAAAHVSQKEHCDSVQDSMDGYSCSYAQAETSRCETMEECFKQAASTHSNLMATQNAELEALRKEWRALLRMECLITTFTTAESGRAAAIDNCQTMDVVGQASTDLSVVEPTTPAMPTCAAPTDTVGSQAYRTAQYGSLPSEAPAKECVASCCKATGGFSGLDFSGLSSPLGSWFLALNIDTGDGNVVAYGNSDFWQSSSAHGGASVDENERFTRDYKNLEVFSQTAAKEVLIVCHEEGKVLGWRTWKLLETKPLRDWFNQANACPGNLAQGSSVQISSQTTGADVGNLIEWEPLIANKHDGTGALYVNSGFSGNDFNRISTTNNGPGNKGSGLGTQYDYNNCDLISHRPTADAEMRTEKDHWGSSGGVGGLIGSDHKCNGGCPWTISSGYDYDYAIFVM